MAGPFSRHHQCPLKKPWLFNSIMVPLFPTQFLDKVQDAKNVLAEKATDCTSLYRRGPYTCFKKDVFQIVPACTNALGPVETGDPECPKDVDEAAEAESAEAFERQGERSPVGGSFIPGGSGPSVFINQRFVFHSRFPLVCGCCFCMWEVRATWHLIRKYQPELRYMSVLLKTIKARPYTREAVVYSGPTGIMGTCCRSKGDVQLADAGRWKGVLII